MKKQIHLNESELHRLVKESVRRVLRESMNEGKKVNNRIPFPLDDEDFVNDEGNIEKLHKDKFADKYTSDEASKKREMRWQQKMATNRRLVYDGILRDESLEANINFLKRGDEKWYEDLSEWGATQWMHFDQNEYKRIAWTSLMELWNVDSTYMFVVRQGKEQEVLGLSN